MSNVWDVLHAHQNPINRNTASALSGGLTYNPSAKDHIDFDVPPLMKRSTYLEPTQKEMIGKKFFCLTVIGVAAQKNNLKSQGSRFVCRCECGNYTLRYRKPLLKTKYQACGACLEKRNRISKEHYRKTGQFLSNEMIWEKMGASI